MMQVPSMVPWNNFVLVFVMIEIACSIVSDILIPEKGERTAASSSADHGPEDPVLVVPSDFG